jgi:NAD(P)-dependent dehydrogenase (short-subunit alcohol dehydrogenase family)
VSNRFVVTGGSAGLGYFTVEQLARSGARVTIAARNPERAEHAADTVRGFVPDAEIDVVRLDLADLASIAAAAEELAAEPIDGMVLNAGALPWDRPPVTRDGFEPVFGTNQLGHFALLAQTFSALTPDAGIVALGSVTHRRKQLRFDRLMNPRRGAYGHSKLAVMTTAIELDRRIRAAGLTIRSTIAHPGYATDALGPVRMGITGRRRPAFALAVGGFAHSKESGAAITVHALLDGEGGHCYGTDGGMFGLRGAAHEETLSGPVLDPEAGAALWAASEELTGVRFAVGTPG